MSADNIRLRRIKGYGSKSLWVSMNVLPAIQIAINNRKERIKAPEPPKAATLSAILSPILNFSSSSLPEKGPDLFLNNKPGPFSFDFQTVSDSPPPERTKSFEQQ